VLCNLIEGGRGEEGMLLRSGNVSGKTELVTSIDSIGVGRDQERNESKGFMTILLGCAGRRQVHET